jgi:hypothetical protein
MNKKVAWGVLGVANIAVKKVLPAMQRGEWCEIVAIASRDLKRAEEAAKQLGIKKAFGSYIATTVNGREYVVIIPMRNFWLIEKSRLFTIHFPIISTSPGPSRPRKPENMCSVKSQSALRCRRRSLSCTLVIAPG